VCCTVAVVVLLSGCGDSEPTTEPLPTSAASFADVECTVQVSDPAGFPEALNGLDAGGTVCVEGESFAGAELVVDRSGEPGRPLLVAADAVQVASVVVAADHVVVQGFVTTGGTGVELSGSDVVARDNYVADAAEDGISCEHDCSDVVVEDNTVVRADGSGIIVEGERITVRGNEVRESERRDAGDADGIRFFGTDVQLLDNVVRDIKDDGYSGEPPHTDCFQTYDNSRLPTVNAVVADNVCRNVDHQCLIATAEEAGSADQIGRSRGLLFTGNECQVEGSQAVLVQWFPDVSVRENTFEGEFLDRAAIFLDGSTGAEFLENTVPEDVYPWQLDDSSGGGFRTDVQR
jgi:hypothetical protein